MRTIAVVTQVWSSVEGNDVRKQSEHNYERNRTKQRYLVFADKVAKVMIDYLLCIVGHKSKIKEIGDDE